MVKNQNDIEKVRAVDPFFEYAINQIFLQPTKTAFVMDGGLGLGKSSNFLMQGAYGISQLVTPIKKGNKMIRESRWACIRESEQSSLSTMLQLLGEGIFTPEIMVMSNTPVRTYGSHPTKILVSHDLPDGTILEMRIECHGFNNDKADNRLRTHEFMGALIPEMQGIPFNIFEVAQQRCGRFRTSDLTISKEIDGKVHTLSGLTKLAMVLCDVNIPERPDPLYEKYYDKPDKSQIPYIFLTPPPPLLYMPTEKAPQSLIDSRFSRVTRFEGKEVVWYPNPKVYNMTRHFEEKETDANGKSKGIPWTGYFYWLNMLHQTDSAIRRYVLGKPDTVGGEAAIYSNFKRNDETIRTRELQRSRPVYMGYDPGGHAAVELCQLRDDGTLHFFKEFYFEPIDGVSTRKIFSDFVLPWCRKNLRGCTVIMIPDPASSWLGKSVMTGQTESVVNMVRDEMTIEESQHTFVSYKIIPCMVSNQDTTSRIESLGYFIDQARITVDPVCEMLIKGLSGQYQKKKLKSGIISDVIDKDNPYSHPAEAAQYPAVNILTNIKKARNERNKTSKRGIYKVKRNR